MRIGRTFSIFTAFDGNQRHMKKINEEIKNGRKSELFDYATDAACALTVDLLRVG